MDLYPNRIFHQLAFTKLHPAKAYNSQVELRDFDKSRPKTKKLIIDRLMEQIEEYQSQPQKDLSDGRD